MYDFSKQKTMLDATLLLLEENNLSEVLTLGGGTALASYYWNHRYSTDIDIFIYDKVDKKHLLKESTWSEKVKIEMKSIGYDGNFRNKINKTFERNGILFYINEDGQINRNISKAMKPLINQIYNTADTRLNDLVKLAYDKFVLPKIEDRIFALEKI